MEELAPRTAAEVALARRFSGVGSPMRPGVVVFPAIGRPIPEPEPRAKTAEDALRWRIVTVSDGFCGFLTKVAIAELLSNSGFLARPAGLEQSRDSAGPHPRRPSQRKRPSACARVAGSHTKAPIALPPGSIHGGREHDWRARQDSNLRPSA